MGLRFRKSIRICKGVRVNVGKTGASLSLGTRGMRYTMHTSGRRTASVGVPGTGLYYTESNNKNAKRKYNSNAYAKRVALEKQKQELAKQKADEIRKNKLLIEEYNNYIEIITNLQKECDEQIHWNDIYRGDPPFIGSVGELEMEARRKYESFTPNIIHRTFQKLEERKKGQLYNAISIARERDKEAYENWQTMHDFAGRILSGDIDAYLEVIGESNPFEDIIEYGCDFEIGTDNPNYIVVEFKAKSSEIIPKIELDITSTGKLSKKQLGKTKYYDYLQDYICGCAIRIAREIFAILPVNNVLVHVNDHEIIDGENIGDEVTILSVDFGRDCMGNIDFNKIDASDFVETFNNNMSFRKTKGFKAVERLNMV